MQIKFNNFTGWRIDNSPVEKDLWVLVQESVDLSWQCAFAVQKVNHILGCTRRRGGQQIYGGDSSPSFSWDPTWNTESHSDVLSIAMTCTCWRESRGEPWRWLEGWNISSVRKVWESWGCPACRREGSAETTLDLWVLKITLWDTCGQTFSQGLFATGQEVMVLNA